MIHNILRIGIGYGRSHPISGVRYICIFEVLVLNIIIHLLYYTWYRGPTCRSYLFLSRWYMWVSGAGLSSLVLACTHWWRGRRSACYLLLQRWSLIGEWVYGFWLFVDCRGAFDLSWYLAFYYQSCDELLVVCRVGRENDCARYHDWDIPSQVLECVQRGIEINNVGSADADFLNKPLCIFLQDVGVWFVWPAGSWD